MKCHDEALYIVSAHISELGITIGQNAVESKSNEIPAVRKLIEMLDISGLIFNSVLTVKSTSPFGLVSISHPIGTNFTLK